MARMRWIAAAAVMSAATAAAQFPVVSHTLDYQSPTTAEGNSGATHGSGLIFEQQLSQASSPVSRLAAAIRRQEIEWRRWLFGAQLHAEKTATALQLAVLGGYYAKADGTKVTYSGGTISVTDATNDQCIWIEVASNTLQTGAAWPGTETDYLPIAIADAAGGVITAVRDARTYVAHRIQPSVTDNGTTAQTSITIDYDNAGAAAASMQVRANRGSSNAEDAALDWVEADARWNVRSQHTTGTLAAVNALSVQISGTTALDSNGAAKAASGVAGDGLAHSGGVLSVGVDSSTTEIASDQVRVKDSGITPAKLSDSLADKIVQISVGDASGASPRTVTIQAQDIQGNNLAETVYFRVRVSQDADGAALATNATIAVGGTGTLVRSETASKDLVVKSSAAGTLTITVTDGTLETIYILVQPTTRSKILDCSDIGTVIIS